MMRKIFALLLAVVTVMMMLAGCGAAPAKKAETEKVTYTDLAGKTVWIKKDVQRIVLIRGRDIYELAALLGDELTKKLVAWGPDIKTADKDAYDKFVEKYPGLKDLPETGDVFSDSVSAEQILTFKPDLVIMDIFMIERGYKCVKKFEEAGLPCIYLDQSGDPLVSPQKSLTLLGQVLGKEEKAKEMVQYVDNQMDVVYKGLEKVNTPAPSVYLESGDKGPTKFGSTYGGQGEPKKYSSWGVILNKLKVRNIADAAASGMATINPEQVLKANPDVIVITGQNWTPPDSMKLGYYANEEESQKSLQGFLNRPGWSSLSAVKNKRVYSVLHNFSMHIFDFVGLQALAKDFYPEVFKDLDPEKNLKEFHDRFMPVKYSGIWMLDLK